MPIPNNFRSGPRPDHYNNHPSGVECIQIVQWFNFNLGNVIKYVWRSVIKDNPIEDLMKARQYLDFEIERLKSIFDVEEKRNKGDEATDSSHITHYFRNRVDRDQ